MNGIPENINWKFLIGKTIEQIKVGQFQTILEIGDVSLSMECEFDFADEKITKHGSCTLIQTLAPLLCLIGHSVTDAFKVNDSLLCLCIEKYKLTIYDSNKNFESFSINGNGFSVIV